MEIDKNEKMIYEAKVVQALKLFYQSILENRDNYPTIGTQLTAFVEKLWQGVQQKNPIIQTEFSNHHPLFLGKSLDDILKTDLTFQDCQLTIARAYGFKNWEAVQANAAQTFDETFETAIDTLLDGDIEGLMLILQKNLTLLQQRSPYGHHAGLIHYLGSNGVEIWRQRVPLNIVAIVNVLKQFGVDFKMTSNIYGGQGDLLGLVSSSAHPWDAGVGKELMAFLNTNSNTNTNSNSNSNTSSNINSNSD